MNRTSTATFLTVLCAAVAIAGVVLLSKAHPDGAGAAVPRPAADASAPERAVDRP